MDDEHTMKKKFREHFQEKKHDFRSKYNHAVCGKKLRFFQKNYWNLTFFEQFWYDIYFKLDKLTKPE